METISGKLGRGLATAAKVGTAAVATAMVKITKTAFNAYGEYEQLTGGIETLFKNSADKLEENADRAYKTANMSANKYMETATSFAGALIKSLEGDTERAVELADMAITDMADNVNKLSTNSEMVQNAYQGFAKQNYTMLDNLKLGYGGTQAEMERLIEDANAVKAANGEMATLSIDSFADIVEAIHIVQEEMGITGATAEEAAETVEGSINTMKAAYENWLVALGDSNADLEEKTNQLVEATLTAAENAGPVIGQILMGLFELAARGVADATKAVMDWIFGGFTEDILMLIDESVALGNGISEGVSKGLGKIDSILEEKIVNPVQTKFEAAKNFVSEKMNAAEETVHHAIENMKSAFDFEWSLPHLKLPRVRIFGSFSLNPPSVPHFGLEWYAAGGILTQPTMFGFNPFTGNAMIGGEAGAEAIAPISTLQDYVSEAVNGSSVVVLTQILEVLTTLLNGGIPMEIDINNVVEIDGAVTARKLYRFLVDEANRHGPKLIT